jgi:predicted dehydrogenase
LNKKHNKINYGIIGFGRYAENRLTPAFKSTKHANLVALSKTNIDNASAKAQQYGIPLYFNDSEELAHHPQVEAVIITSPPAQHKENTIVTAQAGKHVLVEKPISVNANEAAEMVQYCQKMSVKMMTAFVMRFIDAVQETKKVVQSGLLGEIKYAAGYFGLVASASVRNWLENPVISGGGPVADLGAHFIDLLQFVLEKSIINVNSLLLPNYDENNIERNAVVNLQFQDNILGSLFFSFDVFRQSGLTFHGSKAKLVLQNFNQANKEVKIEIFAVQDKTLTVYNNNHYAKMLDHFSRAILFGESIITPGQVGIQNQTIIDEIYGRVKK